MIHSFSNPVKHIFFCKDIQIYLISIWHWWLLFIFVSKYKLRAGTTFLYSTHAFTLLSAVMERAAGQRFVDLMMDMFRDLGMLNTVPDENDPIIYHRSR